MNLYERLLEAGLPLARGKVIERIFIGLGYTAVELSGGSSGLAYTLFEPGCCELLPREVTFWGKPADLVLRGLLSPHPLETVVAFAVLNAVSQQRDLPVMAGDVLEVVAPRPEDEVALVGYFEPLVRRLSGKVNTLWIFEKGDHLRPEFLPETKMPDYLPRADLVFITAVTLLNRTLEDILSMIREAREVVLLGATTPLFPEVFRFTPVTLLSGVQIQNAELIFRRVAEAKGFPSLKEGLAKVNLRV